MLAPTGAAEGAPPRDGSRHSPAPIRKRDRSRSNSAAARFRKLERHIKEEHEASERQLREQLQQEREVVQKHREEIQELKKLVVQQSQLPIINMAQKGVPLANARAAPTTGQQAAHDSMAPATQTKQTTPTTPTTSNKSQQSTPIAAGTTNNVLAAHMAANSNPTAVDSAGVDSTLTVTTVGLSEDTMKSFFKSDKRPRDFDLIVLGGGLEGLACAKEAALLGASVAVAANLSETELFMREHRFLGLLYDAGKQRSCLQECKNYTWDLPECILKPLQFSRLKEAKKMLKKVARERVAQFVDKKRVAYLEETYSCISPYPITVSGTDPENILTAEYMVLAPLGHYLSPDIRGAKYGMRIKDFMQLENLEGNVLVVGNGSDALELAAALLQIGSQTSLMIHNGVLSCFDSEMVALYINSLVEKGLEAFLQTIIKSLEKLESGAIQVNYVSLSKQWNGSKEFDNVVFVDNPIANLKPYLFQNIKLKMALNHIRIDKNFETNVKNVFAIGPAAKYPTFHSGVGTQIGRKLAQYLFENRKTSIIEIADKTGLLRGPVVDYAFVGLSESTANDVYGADNIEVYHGFFKPTEFGIARKPYIDCYLKIICLRQKPSTIFGMHLSGPNAGVVMQGYAAAIRCGLTFEKLTNMAAVFPTVAREFTQLKFTKRSAVELQLQTCCS